MKEPLFFYLFFIRPKILARRMGRRREKKKVKQEEEYSVMGRRALQRGTPHSLLGTLVFVSELSEKQAIIDYERGRLDLYLLLEQLIRLWNVWINRVFFHEFPVQYL